MAQPIDEQDAWPQSLVHDVEAAGEGPAVAELHVVYPADTAAKAGEIANDFKRVIHNVACGNLDPAHQECAGGDWLVEGGVRSKEAADSESQEAEIWGFGWLADLDPADCQEFATELAQALGGKPDDRKTAFRSVLNSWWSVHLLRELELDKSVVG